MYFYGSTSSRKIVMLDSIKFFLKANKFILLLPPFLCCLAFCHGRKLKFLIKYTLHKCMVTVLYVTFYYKAVR